jgi:indolepyruvate ferredoxin oxidoreductase alpha subunit
MAAEIYNGDQSIALGAIESGVSVVTGYPGSPGTGTFNTLADTQEVHGHQAEWCPNERIALDIAAGASQGGKRALVCLKSVGMNVALDTLMVLNMTGVHAGLVILLGDDPGAWGSQNEQDTRPVGNLSELPVLEPASPEEGRRMAQWAFEFSEKHRSIVIIRITRSFSVSEEAQPAVTPPKTLPSLPPSREQMRWISSPFNTIQNHRRLHERLAKITTELDASPFNQLIGNGPRGILAGGFVFSKLRDALGGAHQNEVSLLKLSALHPLPAGLITRFMAGCEEILVLEEVDPYLEDAIKTVGYDAGVTPKITGKRTGHVSWEGELFRWQIQNALKNYIPNFLPGREYLQKDWEKEKPARKSHCAGCPYEEIVKALREEAAALGQNPFLTADPGCVVMAAKLLDTKLCMGSSVGAAIGLRKAGVKERTVAFTGDSAFYHSSINGLVHAGATGADLLMIVLDNGGALTTGGQPSPDRAELGANGAGNPVSIENMAKTCGVRQIWTVGPSDSDEQMRSVFRDALSTNGLDLIIIRKQCESVP